jgi:hypothetical protein
MRSKYKKHNLFIFKGNFFLLLIKFCIKIVPPGFPSMNLMSVFCEDFCCEFHIIRNVKIICYQNKTLKMLIENYKII